LRSVRISRDLGGGEVDAEVEVSDDEEEEEEVVPDEDEGRR